MQKKYLDHYDEIKSCIKKALDDMYDVLDSASALNLTTNKTEAIASLAKEYEILLKNFIDKKDLTSLEEGEVSLAINQALVFMKKQHANLAKAIHMLEAILSKL